MKYNVIFLDFDGPLTNARSYLAYDKPLDRKIWTTADPVAIALINRLIAEYNAKIVVSSSWRIDRTGLSNPTGLNAVDTLYYLWGLAPGSVHEDWATPGISLSAFNEVRTKEIQKWLYGHKDEVENFCSIDDMQLKKCVNIVKVRMDDGISYGNYSQAKQFLGGGGYSVEKCLETY